MHIYTHHEHNMLFPDFIKFTTKEHVINIKTGNI